MIEGSAGRLDGLLMRLECDPRHKDIVVLDDALSVREFAHWSMATARITLKAAEVLDAPIAAPVDHAAGSPTC